MQVIFSGLFFTDKNILNSLQILSYFYSFMVPTNITAFTISL